MKRFVITAILLLVALNANANEEHEHHDDHAHHHEDEIDTNIDHKNDIHDDEISGHNPHSEHEHESGDHIKHEDEAGHDDDHEDHDGHSEELSTRISDAIATQVGIESVKATSQQLTQRIVSYGSLTTGPEQLSHVRARYAGLITSVKPTIGDQVKRGDLLAEVESNESLKTYQILAPISGTVVQRHANTGENTQDQVLFSIANYDTLWAEFRLYPTQQSLVLAGQTAFVSVNGSKISSVIQHIIPALDKPYQLARAKFDNTSSSFTPGLLVEGHIVTGEYPVPLAVDKNAIQTLGEQRGVFVKTGDDYQFTPLELGRGDGRYVEVISGLKHGQRYVSKNSYLLKADIEKSEAEHAH